jgi:hypothetical protein
MNCPDKVFSRVFQGRGTLRVPGSGREASRPYNRNQRLVNFLRVHQIYTPLNSLQNKPYPDLF